MMGKIFVFITFLLFLLFGTLPVSAHKGLATSEHFRHFNEETGLSANQVFQATQDERGFIWLATANGLDRFDGTYFKSFKQSNSQKNTISENTLQTVFYDSRGYIWIGTVTGGLNRYNYATGEFTSFQSNAEDPNSISSDKINNLFEDSKGRLWIGTENGLNLFNYEEETFSSCFHNPNYKSTLGASIIRRIVEDRQGRIWVGTWGGGLQLLAEEQTEELSQQTSFKHFFPGNNKNITALLSDSKGRLWIGTEGGGVFLTVGTSSTSTPLIETQLQFAHLNNSPNGLSDLIINDLEERADKELWIATPSGLNRFSFDHLKLKKASFATIQRQLNRAKIQQFHVGGQTSGHLANEAIQDIFKDREGGLWISTMGGLSHIKPQQQLFEEYTLFTAQSGFGKIKGIVEHQQKIWLATEGKGLVEYRINTGKWKKHTAAGINISALYREGNTLYLGTEKGLGVINMNSQRFNLLVPYHKYASSQNYEAVKINSIFADQNRQFWLLTNNGLVRYDRKRGTVRKYQKEAFDKNSPSHNALHTMIEEADGTLWVGTAEGLNKISFKKDGTPIFKHFFHDPKDPHSLPNNYITAVVLKKDRLIIGTQGGLSWYDPDKEQFHSFQGMESGKKLIINALLPGTGDYLLGSTPEALFKFDLSTQACKRYGKEYGMENVAFSLGAAYLGQEGYVYFGNQTGIVRYKERALATNKQRPKVLVTDLLAFGQPLSFKREISTLNKIVVSFKDKYLTFRFAAMDFNNPEVHQYQYKLEGLDENWVSIGNQRAVTFTNLSGGTYKFKVRALTNGTDWGQLYHPIKLVVRPPIWKTWWFISLLLLFIGAAVWGFIQYRTHFYMEKSRILTEMNDRLSAEIAERRKVERALLESNEELKRSNHDLEQFAYIASHDLQEPLRMVGNFVQLLKRRYANQIDPEGREFINYAVEGVVRMSNLIRSILSYSKVGNKDIRFMAVRPKKIITQTIAELTPLMERRQAEVIIYDLPEEIVCEPGQFRIIMHNLINNAIKFNHSDKPLIFIDYKEQFQHWLFSIKDNGIGIDKEFQHKVFAIFKRLNQRSEFEGNGIGLALSKKIVERHNGQIWYESIPGKGSTFFFTIAKTLQPEQVRSPEEESLQIQ